MVWIILGIVLIGFGVAGIYYGVYRYDRSKLNLDYMPTPTSDSIVISILMVAGIIVIAILFDKLPAWLARILFFLICLVSIAVGIALIMEEM